MKTKKILLILILITFLILPIIGLSQPQTAPSKSPYEVLEIIFNELFKILMIVAAIFFVIAGYHFVAGQGDPEKFNTAKRMVLYGIIGLIVAFAAKGLVTFIGTVLK